MTKIEYVILKSPTGIIIKIPIGAARTFEYNVLGGYRISVVEEENK
jgi:hypothetical protein